MLEFKVNRILKHRIVLGTITVISIFLFVLFAFLAFYINLPKDSPLRTKMHLGKKLKFLEFGHYFYNYQNLGIPIYDLKINRKNLKKLYDNIPPLKGFVEDKYKEYVPATFYCDGKEYKVKVRFRGLLAGHWIGDKKSWRINFKKENLFEGKKIINLIIPADRAHIIALLNKYIAEKMGLLCPDIKYVFLRVNGRLHGVCHEIEKPRKEFLEKKQRADMANLYSDDYFGWWQKTGTYTDIYKDICFWKKDAAEEVSGFENCADLDYLLSLVGEANDETFYKQVEYILDMDKFLKWQVLCMLEGSYHSNERLNGLFYFNPCIGKFEPIVWDINQWLLEEKKFFDKAYHPLITRILLKPEYLHQRNLILWAYINNPENLKNDLQFYDENFKKIRKAYYCDRNKGYSNWGFNRDIKEYRRNIIANRDKIGKDLSFSELLVNIKLPATSSQNKFKNKEVIAMVDVKSYSFSAAMLEGIYLYLDKELIKAKNDFSLYCDSDNSGNFNEFDSKLGEFVYKTNNNSLFAGKLNTLLYSDRDDNLQPVPKNYRFFVVSSSPLDSKFTLSKIKLESTNAVTLQNIKPRYRYINQNDFSRFNEITQTAEEFLARYDFFQREKENSNALTLSRKIVNISKTVIIPRGLIIDIKPGTTIRFAAGISLISYSPLVIRGREDSPVIFSAIDPKDSWGVLAIVNTPDSLSKIEYAIFEYGNEFFLNGIYFTGALAVHNAPIKIERSLFRYCSGDDALNVKSADAVVSQCSFLKNLSDAIDFDFANGKIEHCYFSNNRGDSIDLCASSPEMTDNFIEYSGDKGISIGEESSPEIVNNLIINCNIGIASKDKSNPSIVNNIVTNNDIGISAYKKKDIFGGAKGNIQNTIIWGNKTQISEDELSRLSISNCLIEDGYRNGKNIINQEPIFIEPQKNDYTLKDCEQNAPLFRKNIGLLRHLELALNLFEGK